MPVSDPKQRVELIQSDEAQISLNPSPATVQDFLYKNLQVQEAPTKNLAFLVFHSSIFQEVRRAISNGIDRQKIVRWVFAGRGRASGSVMDPTLLPKNYHVPKVFRSDAKVASRIFMHLPLEKQEQA